MQVVETPGAKDVTGQVTATAVAGEVAVSVTTSEDTVTFPVFFTTKE